MACAFFGFACVLMFGSPATLSSDTLGDPGPNLLPRVVGLCAALLSVLLFFEKTQQRAPSDAVLERPLTIALSLLAIPAFYLLFEYLGYTVAVTLYLLAAFSLLGPGTLGTHFRYALSAAAFSLTSGLLFARLLDLPLPGVLP